MCTYRKGATFYVLTHKLYTYIQKKKLYIMSFLFHLKKMLLLLYNYFSKIKTLKKGEKYNYYYMIIREKEKKKVFIKF